MTADDPEESFDARAALAQSGRLARQPPTPRGNDDRVATAAIASRYMRASRGEQKLGIGLQLRFGVV
jgi:hypothetical protein